MAIHNREFDDERCKNCSVNAKCLGCDVYLKFDNPIIKELEKIKDEIEDTGAYEQEVNGKTEFLKGINYCLNIIDKYKAESEETE